MRMILPLNNGWIYSAENNEEEICLPHTNCELPYNCFNESGYQFKSSYIRNIAIPESADGKRIFIDFEGVMASAEVTVDGKAAGSHAGGYTGFSVEITDYVSAGKTHRLEVMTDASENPEIPPFGNVIDYLTYGGIYREVQMRITEQVFIENIFTEAADTDKPQKTLQVTVTLAEKPVEGTSIEAELRSSSGSLVCTAAFDCPESRCRFTLNSLDVELWDIDTPNLYDLTVRLIRGIRDENRTVIDEKTERTGFRSCRFTENGFYLNGRRLKLRGLNRHQSFPYAGYAMPERVQRRDADILKDELGLNLVRCSHYPMSRHFLDRCDEIGLLVFEELPGWQHIGGDRWKANALESLEEMIIRDRNRPSIIIWGVRINESQDDHDFYLESNRLARSLDPGRQTGGVRYIEHSELLEDVYTMNDFVHSGCTAPQKILRKPAKVSRNKATGRKPVPYLVTEHNGHMYPTKRFDNEERTREHALRHLRVLDRAFSDPHISGAIGWCAFDYNTHREFGSGDRICYHGVSDMFRVPKPAAAVYASQKDPAQGIVLEPASLFAKGERSAARILPIEVYTNCDFIKLYRNGREVGDYRPAYSDYPGLEHPPVIINDLVGSQLENSRFSRRDQKILKEMISFVMINGEEALKPHHMIKMGLFMKRNRMKFSDLIELFLKYSAGWGDSEDSFELAGYYKCKEVVRRKFGAGSLSALTIKADDHTLQARTPAGTWDSTRVEFRLTDENGNIMPYASEYIKIEVEGPAVVIGPELTAFAGGVYAAWLKTTGETGTVKVKASCSRLESEKIEIKVLQAMKITI